MDDPRIWVSQALRDPAPLQVPPEQDRKSAVLLPILRRDKGPTLLFVRKSQHLAKHAGQVGFPGGAIDATDGSVEATALREAREEIGLEAANVELLGRLDDERTLVTHFHIAPLVGWVETPPATWQLDAFEIESVIEVDLAEAVACEPSSWLEYRWQEVLYRAPRYEFSNGLVVWGASARILLNLQRRLRSAGAG